MTRHNVDYKKIRTDIINGKKRCIYMKPKGKREYVKSGGEFVSLSAYIKTLQKKNKKKGGAGYIDERGRHIDRDTFLANVGRRLADLKAKSTSLTKGLMGKGLDELVPDATNFNRRVYHENPRFYNSDYVFFNHQSLQNSNFNDTKRRQEAREKAHKLGSKIRNAFLGNKNGNSEEHASQRFDVAEVRRYDARGRHAPVVRSGVTAELVYPISPQRRPTAPSTYSDDDIGFA
jgi:hypothetical protein